MSVTSRSATAEDIAKYHPDVTCSFRAWVFEVDGEPAGIIGVALSKPVAWLFSSIDEPLRPYLTDIRVWRVIHKTYSLLCGIRIPVMAIRDRNEKKSPQILKRMGFKFFDLIEGEPVYMRY